MNWVGRLRTVVGRWAVVGLDVVMPPRCAVCGADVPEARPGPSLCAVCSAALKHDGRRCGRCGAPGADAACGTCRRRRPAWDGMVVVGGYADALRTAVLRAKRPAGERVAAALAALLVDHHRDTLVAWSADVVVPVPMHWMRRAIRGTSAADEVARGVAAGLGLPRRHLLRRARATTMQNRLPVAERRGNVRNAFRARGRLAGLRILLVDDVTTTGATLEACTATAISAGAEAVYAAAVARADGDVTGDA